jgi:hypothetical protein
LSIWLSQAVAVLELPKVVGSTLVVAVLVAIAVR